MNQYMRFSSANWAADTTRRVTISSPLRRVRRAPPSGRIWVDTAKVAWKASNSILMDFSMIVYPSCMKTDRELQRSRNTGKGGSFHASHMEN